VVSRNRQSTGRSNTLGPSRTGTIYTYAVPSQPTPLTRKGEGCSG
jgi:hypothetical protein